MKKLVQLAVLAMNLFMPQFALAHDPSHATRHNLVLFGRDETFASHIVYKAPHNFQVILEINFDFQTHQKYLLARQAQPDGLFIFLLEPIDISRIESADILKGALLYEDVQGHRHTVVPEIALTKESYRLVYFNELPLALGLDQGQVAKPRVPGALEENCHKIKCQ